MSLQARLRVERSDFELNVDLKIPSTGITAVFGPSGSGKTTILRSIAGLDRFPAAHIQFGSQVWQSENRFVPSHQRALGFVFQQPSLFDHLDVEGNIRFGFRRVPASQRQVAVEDCVDLLDLGSLLTRKPHQISGGEQQRVAIARALASSPQILLMDEPMASLDDARKLELLPYFESLHQKLEIPILYVSHAREEVLRLADHLVLLGHGQVEAQGPACALASRLDLSLALRSDAQSILETTVTGFDESFGLTHLSFSGGSLAVTRRDLPVGAKVRLLVRASDISLTLERASQTSILNILAARVDDIGQPNAGQQTVRLLLGRDSLLARLTQKSVFELGLSRGKDVFAQIKSVAVLKETSAVE